MAIKVNGKTRMIIESDDNLDRAGQYAYMESNKWYDIANMLSDEYASQKYICLLFSCELYLKAILMFNSVNASKRNYSHDLFKMYNDLGNLDKEKIKNSIKIDSIIRNPITDETIEFESFDEELKHISNDFMYTRYEYEKFLNGFQIYILMDFVKSLSNILLNICKNYIIKSMK